MIPYILAALFPLLVESVYTEHLNRAPVRARKKRWVYVLIAILPLFVMIAFRNQSLGADTGVYLRHFQATAETAWGDLFENTRMEFGYLVFVKLLTCVTDSPLVYQIIYTLIYFSAIFVFCNQQERSPFFFLFLFCALGLFTFMFTGVRQCIAMSICLFSYPFIRKKKIIPFVFLVILAAFFHRSAILFVVAYFIYGRKINPFYVALYGVLSFASVYFLENIQDFFNDALDYDYEIETTASSPLFLVFILLLTTASIILLFSYKTLTVQARGFANVAIITVFFWILRLFTRVAERPSYYFLFFSCALIATAVDSLKSLKERYITKTAVVALCMVLYAYRLATNLSTLLPYSFYS